MASTAPKKILQTILKCQELAAKNSNQNEAEVAAKRALDLMLQHAVTQADLDAERAAVEDPLVKKPVVLDGTRCIDFAAWVAERRAQGRHWGLRKLSTWKRNLASEVARYMQLRFSYVEGSKEVSFYGFRSDCEAAARLYEVCARQIDAQCKAYLRERREDFWRESSGEQLSVASDWKQSAVRGLAARFEEILEESRAEAGEEVQTAHALVFTRKQKVDDWVNATYKFGKGSSAAFGNQGWNLDGFEAGKNLKLHDHAGLGGGATKALEGA